MKDKKRKIIGIILFILTLISPLMAFALSTTIGEVDIFGGAGMILYSWVMWFFIPIGILSILIGISLKKHCQKYKKNIVIAAICIPLLIIFGSYRFIFASNFSYDVNRVAMIEKKTSLKLPEKVKIVTERWDSYYISYAKITNAECKRTFEQEIETNSLWQKDLSPRIKMVLPQLLQNDTVLFDYFVFYNETTNEYNISPSDGTYDCIFMAYNTELTRLMILDSYRINLY